MSKTVCIYHSIDLDGWMSAAIVKHWFTQERHIDGKPYSFDSSLLGDPDKDVEVLDFIGYNYGQTIPNLEKYDKIIMCDISFPKEEMRKIAENYHFIWIDHHISALKDNAYLIDLAQCESSNIKLRLNTSFAACELTWQFFFQNFRTPEIVWLLGMYDCFRHKGTDEEQKVLKFQYGARALIQNVEDAYKFLKIDLQPYTDIVGSILADGESIYKYLCTEARQTYSNGFEVELKEKEYYPSGNTTGITNLRKFICINKERFNPINFGINYHEDGYDGCACFHYANGIWNFSLYNYNGLVDCSAIAKQYGGGGHKGASGFKCTSEQLVKIINK